MTKKILAGYFICLILTPAFFSEILLRRIEKEYTGIVFGNLSALAAVQKSRIQEMLYAEYQRILGVTSRTALRSYLAGYLDTRDAAILPNIQKIMTDAKKPFGDIKEIFIVDSGGNSVVSTPEPEKTNRVPVSPSILARGMARPTVMPYERDARVEANQLILLGPIGLDGKLLGALGMIIENKAFRAITRDHSGLGNTGETLVARKNDRGDAELFGETRKSGYSEPFPNVHQHELSKPMTQALFRYEGIWARGTDYEGTPVFAATRFVPEEEWGIVVKIDRAEALEPIRRLRAFLYMLLAILCLVWLLMGYAWVRWILKTS